MNEVKMTNLAKRIDSTQLRADTTPAEIRRLCREAREWKFATVCINPYYVPLAVAELNGSHTKVCAVAGFPLGANTIKVKVTEVLEIATAGAHEIDLVLNIGMLKAGDFNYLTEELEQVLSAGRRVNPELRFKLILETGYLTEDEILQVVKIGAMVKVDYIKNATGFGPSGADVAAVKLLQRAAGPDIAVKAAGGIKDLKTALALIEAGADRLGTSSARNIMQEAQQLY